MQLSRWLPRPSPEGTIDGRRLPTFLVVGAMRSGTTSIAGYLREHPEVFVSTPKELHFFDWNWERGLDWYAERFSGAGSVRAVGEATPGYMYFGNALDRMAATCPEARLIVILRNPVDRAYSHYWFNRTLGIEDVGFDRAIEREPERLTTHAVRRVFAYVDMGRYVSQLEALCTHYARSSLHVVLFDDLISDPQSVFGSVCRFLQVDPDFTPSTLGVARNGYVEYRSRGVQRLVRSMPRSWQRPLQRLNRRPSAYPSMGSHMRRKLDELFARDNERLSQWLERDLSSWSTS